MFKNPLVWVFTHATMNLDSGPSDKAKQDGKRALKGGVGAFASTAVDMFAQVSGTL